MPKRGLGYLGFTVSLLFSVQTATAQASRSGAQAFVTDSSARFVFPREKRQAYTWDLPVKGAYADMPEFAWQLDWDRPSIVPGKDPIGLWLITRWRSGGPHKGTLAELVRGYTLDPVIECTSCDGAVYTDPQRDTNTVFATVERGSLVFNIRGRQAMHRIFRVLPDTVTFSRSVMQTPHPQYGPGEISETQVVLVNCSPGKNPQRRRSCVVPAPVFKRRPDADSAAAENAPRQVYVPVIRFANATLRKHVRVRIKKPDGSVWKVLSTGSLGGVRLSQPPLGPLLLEALCPNRGSGQTAISGSVFIQVTPRADTSVHLMTDPTVCSP